MGWSVAAAIGVVSVGFGYLARAALAKRAPASGAGGSSAPGAPLAEVCCLLVPAAGVLLLSWQLLAFCEWSCSFHAWALKHGDALRAWFSFWWLMLLIDGCEFALRLVYAMRRKPFPVPALIRNILRVVLVVGAVLLVAKSILGRDISTALASTALLTAVIGFALQGVLGNLLAGLSMHIVRSTVPGDWVAIGDVEGEVVETNWRETRLRTVGGHMLVLPNSKVAEAVIHNMTHPTPVRRIAVAVGASYSDAPAEVIAALEAAALSVPEVLREPRANAVMTQYLDFGINYELRFWTNRFFDRARLISDVQCRIWYQFKRRGIEIPFPMSDKLLNDFMEVVYNQRSKPSADEEVDRHLAELKRSDFCRKLLVDEKGQPLVDDEALRPVVKMMRRVFFTKGEVLFNQGEVGESAYVLVRGSLDGRVEFDANVAPLAFTVQAGALLGEMSLVTGLPRTATLVAADEVQLLEMPRDAFVRLLAVRQDVPAKLAELSAQRAASNAAMFAQLKSVPRAGLKESLQRDSILTRFMRMLSFKG
jgi:small-conductance mechanosensitive channel/CRP-like cAMP-binding protein